MEDALLPWGKAIISHNGREVYSIQVSSLTNTQVLAITIREFDPFQKEDKVMKKWFTIACRWTMYGEFLVEAETLEEAVLKVEAGEKPYDGLPNDDDYVDSSFEVDKELSEVLTKESEENKDG